ncbi:hypothetical protein [Longitalea luteola]|uniref:hypothetical protein n=1 Tax=Longitalea luteola TaxID=2812563 RepID=UPI001A9626CD|nr:hypothetical protein [Longitalea luteola]
MNLIKYNIESENPYIYIDNIELPAFMNILGSEKEIVLSELFGYTGDRYFSKNDFPPKMTTDAFLRSIESLKISNIKDLVFQSEGYKIVVDDCNTYHINADSSLILNVLKEICKKILLTEEFYKHIRSFEDLYLLFDNGRLVETFETFDQYLESEYSD